MEGGAVRHHIERGPLKDLPPKIWLNLVRWIQRKIYLST
jgi:hypothetical protein